MHENKTHVKLLIIINMNVRKKLLKKNVWKDEND